MKNMNIFCGLFIAYNIATNTKRELEMKKLFILLSFLFTTASNAALIQHIQNGDFETGDFTGWTNVNTGSGLWNINDGSFPINGGFVSLSPISGSFDAVTTQTGPGFHNLYQEVTLSAFDSAIFSWDDRIRTNSQLSDPNQEWRVLVQNVNGSLISELFSTNPGDAGIQTGPNSRSYDLTALLTPLIGQTVRFSFEQQDNAGFFSASLDNVSFTTEVIQASAPLTGTIFGLGLMGLMLTRKRKLV
jgi:hypothetical protein